LKRPERELVGRELKRVKNSVKPAKAKRAKTSGFQVLGRTLFIAGPIALVLLVVATFFTPLLAIEQIKVSGHDRIKASKVMGALEELVGKPLTTVSQDNVAELLADFALIETFTLQAEPPHTLTVKIRERQPIVILVRGGKNYLYDAAGVRIDVANSKDKYPYFRFTADPLKDKKYRTAMEVLLSLPVNTYKQVFSIQVSDQLTTDLILRKSDTRVIWGNAKQGLLKAEVLNSLIETGVKPGVTIDVSSPKAPVVTYPNY
jgi:cell division protein FtsQ